MTELILMWCGLMCAIGGALMVSGVLVAIGAEKWGESLSRAADHYRNTRAFLVFKRVQRRMK